jgi:hypothetical protein
MTSDQKKNEANIWSKCKVIPHLKIIYDTILG